MKLFRFMSVQEFASYNAGLTISGKDHRRKYRTSSTGVCFLAEKVAGYDEGSCEPLPTCHPRDCYQFLNGIVSDELLVCLEIDEHLVSLSDGRYAAPYGNFDDYIRVEEFTVPKYSLDTARLISYEWVRNGWWSKKESIYYQ